MASQKTLRSIVADIREFCESNADQKQVESYARYFKEGYDAYGVHQDAFIEKKDKLLEEYRDKLSLEDVLKLGEMLETPGSHCVRKTGNAVGYKRTVFYLDIAPVLILFEQQINPGILTISYLRTYLSVP